MASDRIIFDLSLAEAEHLLLELAGASPLMDQFKAQLRDEMAEKANAARIAELTDELARHRAALDLPPCS